MALVHALLCFLFCLTLYGGLLVSHYCIRIYQYIEFYVSFILKNIYNNKKNKIKEEVKEMIDLV